MIARPWMRTTFWVYAAALFVATHWPKLTLPASGRPDIYVHALVFAVWTGLLISAGFFGPALSARNIVSAWAIAAVWSGIDEALQAVPFIRRNAAWDDWAANLAGVTLAGAAALIVARLSRRDPARTGSPI